MKFSMQTLTVMVVLVQSGLAAQESIPRAEAFYKHGLVGDAKRDAIVIIHSDRGAEEQSAARMLLARIAFDEKRLADAAALWREVVRGGADSEAGKSASRLLEQFSDVQAETSTQTTRNAVATSYLTNADFWMAQLDRQFTVDSSYLEVESAAVHWLERVIAEFPGTPEAEQASALRVRAYLGVEGRGRFGIGGSGALGASSRLRSAPEPSGDHEKDFHEWMSSAEGALRQMEKAFPKSARLQRLRYMIVQAYWQLDLQAKAKPWLKSMVEAESTHETFWSHVAKLRTAHWDR